VNSPKGGVACLCDLPSAFLAPDASVSESEYAYEKRFITQFGDSHVTPTLHTNNRELDLLTGIQTADLWKHRHSVNRQASQIPTHLGRRVHSSNGNFSLWSESTLKEGTPLSCLWTEVHHAPHLEELYILKTHKSSSVDVVRGQDRVGSKWSTNPGPSRVMSLSKQGLRVVSLPLESTSLSPYGSPLGKPGGLPLNYSLFYSFRRNSSSPSSNGDVQKQGGSDTNLRRAKRDSLVRESLN
jgi:hypothetical protein